MKLFKRSITFNQQKTVLNQQKTVVITVELPKGQELSIQGHQEQKTASSQSSTRSTRSTKSGNSETKSWGFRWILNVFSTNAQKYRMKDSEGSLSSTEPNTAPHESTAEKDNTSPHESISEKDNTSPNESISEKDNTAFTLTDSILEKDNLTTNDPISEKDNTESTDPISEEDSMESFTEKSIHSDENNLSDSDLSLSERFDDRDDSSESRLVTNDPIQDERNKDEADIIGGTNDNIHEDENKEEYSDDTDDDNDHDDKYAVHNEQHQDLQQKHPDSLILKDVDDTTSSLPPLNNSTKEKSSSSPNNIKDIINKEFKVQQIKSTQIKPQTLKEMRRTASNGSKKFIHVFHNQLTPLQERPSREESDNESVGDNQQQKSKVNTFDEHELQHRWNYSLEVMARVALQREKREKSRKVDRYIQ